MPVEGHRIGVEAFPRSEWAFAASRDFTNAVHLAQDTPQECDKYFTHKGVQYYRAKDGNVYRRMS
jgi:hypothetical protein